MSEIANSSVDSKLRALAEKISPALHRYFRIEFSDSELPTKLRKERAKNWCEAALNTILDKRSAKDICYDWSLVADKIVTEAFSFLNGHNLGLALFAIGKWGSKELNLSSDIDYVFVADELRDEHTRFCRQFQSLISEVSSFGFCFRSDLDLRPGGRMGPLVPTAGQFEDYYGNHGETWERLALVRIRYICGSESVKKQIESFCSKFIYRKHLDYTLLEDLKNLRSRIHASRTQSDEHSIHLKLDVGGIRDIELFAHALLVIHGGKDPSIRTNLTGEAFERLKSRKMLKDTEADFLGEFYWRLRKYENFVQALEDTQTHTLQKKDLDVWREINPIPASEWTEIKSGMQVVDVIVSSLLGKVEAQNEFPDDEDQQDQWLSDQGLRGEKIQAYWNEILSLTALSQKRERDEKSRREFLSHFVNDLREIAIDSELAFSHLRDFLKSTRAKATFFTLLNREPHLRKKLAWLFSVSPYLSRLLTERPELLDSYFYRQQDVLSEDWDVLLNQLLEKKLLTELTVGSDFLTDRNLKTLLSSLSQCADEVVITILKKLKSEHPGSTLDMIPLGKWGGKELGFRSDLDFAFITKDEPTVEDYKIARRVISRLTDPHKGGNLYSIDLRLRPSGNSGPLIASQEKLKNFLEKEAEAWIRQAYLKSRCLLGTFQIPRSTSGFSTEELDELKRIRKELLEGKLKQGLDLKYSRGGLIDIEFTTQIAVLKNKIESAGTSTEEQIKKLSESLPEWKNKEFEIVINYRELRLYEQMLQLVGSSSGSQFGSDKKELEKVSAIFKTDVDNLLSHLEKIFKSSKETLKDLDPSGALTSD